MQVDWGGKLMVNHTSEYMLSEVDWGAHETHPNGHSIQVYTLCMDPCFLKLIGKLMIHVPTI